MKGSSKKRSRSEAPPSEKPRRSPVPCSPLPVSPPPAKGTPTTPSSRKKRRDRPQPSHTSKKRSLSPAPSSRKRRRSPLPSSPKRAPTQPTELPATNHSKRKPRVQPCSSSGNPGRPSPPPSSPPAPGKAEAVVPPPIPPLSDDQQEKKANIPKLFQRMWKNGDEIALLNGMLEFKRRLGKEPASSEDFDALYESVKDSLELKVTRDQMMTKRLGLRRKFKGKIAKLQMGWKPSGDMHEQRCLELARLLWGEDCPKDDNDKKHKGRSGRKPKEALQRVRADDSDDVLVRLAEEACCPDGVLVRKRMMNFKPEKLRVVRERYASELQMEIELREQRDKLEAQIMEAIKAAGKNDDFSSSSDDADDDDDDDVSDS